ncbi:Ppx/GppA phosphatase family protein [Arcanobacterium hippocoleae]|uniref:Ppx/GppA phosphatase family protein n=1 Tax=Arcanobacterium hippocoleae TaxID=149017 RepID=UPI0033414EC6
MKVAGIDCGTNTIRLLISEILPGRVNALGGPALRDCVREMRVVRLGAGVDKTGRFNPQALQRTLDAVAEYAQLCRAHEVVSIRFAATSATRDAENRDIFIDGVYRLLGVRPQVISGEQEALTSFTGAVCAVDRSDLDLAEDAPVIAVDLGGGSTELALGTLRGELLSSFSMDVGSVRMHERHLGANPAAAAIAAARADVQAFLDTAEMHVDLAAAHALIGLAGTVTSITAKWLGLDVYDSQQIHGAKMSISQVQETCQWFIDANLAQRKALGFMHPGRADVIQAGALIWQEVVQRVVQRSKEAGHEISHVVTSEHDILDGLALWAANELQSPVENCSSKG